MEKINWKVDGMTCANCALTINRYLQQQGLAHIYVNPIGGEVSFDMNGQHDRNKIAKGIESLGYRVNEAEINIPVKPFTLLGAPLHRFLFCIPFTLLLVLNMLPFFQWHWLMNPWIQLLITIPVFVTGINYFGRSAVKSIKNGMANMNVLISFGASVAFTYSLAGTIFHLGETSIFYETAATIFTLVFLGNYLEDMSMSSMQAALRNLVRSQKVMANMIAFDEDHKELLFTVENKVLRPGDLVMIRAGEQVPADGKILWGEAYINESLISGESLPVFKKKKDKIIGGSILENGQLKVQITAAGSDTVLSRIMDLVNKAQSEKSRVQILADRVSAVFVPAVIIIGLLTIAINWIIIRELTPSLLRGITVLIIACPCAMGLATPAAISVGLGRASGIGILFRNSNCLELFKNIKQVVFDKTGTLTTGKFSISHFKVFNIDEDAFKQIVYSLEKYSSHPIAVCISSEWPHKNEFRWSEIEEIRGFGMKCKDHEGNIFMAGSTALMNINGINITDDGRNVYISRNKELIGWISVNDEIRPEAPEVVNYFHSRHIKTILLSGDVYENCINIASQLKIDEVIAGQTPADKLEKIKTLTEIYPTIMVGDGINDAPALAKATIGVSMSEASQLAMQSAQVVLIGQGLRKLPLAFALARETYLTVKQNLFWAFLYNIITIPVAAAGLMGMYAPAYGALIMGLSDVVLILNSLRLFAKRLN